MLTKLTIRNFKRLEEVEIELGHPVLFVGPNNSGKTSTLQALSLWEIGVKRWSEKERKRSTKKPPGKRPGAAINRRDLIAVPVPEANLLWRNLHVREVVRSGSKAVATTNVRIDIIVEGITAEKAWRCGLEFDYANDESLFCRPLRIAEGDPPERMPFPDEAIGIQVAFLPPMSGLSANETRLERGAVNVRVGEGRTAEVLRNLCHAVCESQTTQWEQLSSEIASLFGVELEQPVYIAERGEITMGYKERNVRLDISSAGRGLQQTLLLLAYMYANPGAVLLLDEPDAHLEILRQRQIYHLLTEVASRNGNQIIAASHSEVLLNEAAGKDMVVAFVGKPHRIDDRGSQVQKALREIGFDHYYQAEQTGWVLYLEGSTDLAILQAFAKRLSLSDARSVLERPYVFYVGNDPNRVRQHFFGLREAVPHLLGIAIFDRLDQALPADLGARGMMWSAREIENYLCVPEALESYAVKTGHQTTMDGPLFSQQEVERRRTAMKEAIGEVERALETLGKGSPWAGETKVSDDFLGPVFEKYYKKLKLPNIMTKKNFYELASLVPVHQIDGEIEAKLEAIVEVAAHATPAPTP